MGSKRSQPVKTIGEMTCSPGKRRGPSATWRYHQIRSSCLSSPRENRQDTEDAHYPGERSRGDDGPLDIRRVDQPARR